MNYNEFNVFVETYISEINKSNDNRKIRIFAKYIERYSRENNYDILELFESLNEDFLLNNIFEYITEYEPTQNVAVEYKRIIINFSKGVCQKNKIINSFLNSVDKQEAFNISSSELFGMLKESERTDCMSREELKFLNEKIGDYFSMEDFNDNILACIEKSNTKRNYYGKLVSAIALKLIECFGLSNDVIAQLKISSLNIEKRQLMVNGFDLFLNDDITSYFQLYLKYRQVVIEKVNTEIDELFITNKGKAYLTRGHANNGSLFVLLKDVFNSVKTTGLQYRAIVDLVSKGANIELLHQLTGTDSRTIAEICIGEKSEFEDLFKPTKYITNKTVLKGRFICPTCKKMIEATSEKAVLLKHPNDDTLYLYCRECGEKEKIKFGGMSNE